MRRVHAEIPLGEDELPEAAAVARAHADVYAS
jgi:hypothetical protein